MRRSNERGQGGSPVRSWRHTRAHPIWLASTSLSAALLVAGLIVLALGLRSRQLTGSRVVFRAPAWTAAIVLARSAIVLRERVRSLDIDSSSVTVDAAGE